MVHKRGSGGGGQGVGVVHQSCTGGGGQGGRSCSSKSSGGGDQGVVRSRVEVVGVKGWWSRVVEVKAVE